MFSTRQQFLPDNAYVDIPETLTERVNAVEPE